MNTTYKVTTEPTTEPITLDALKDALRIGSCDFDEQLTELLKACRKQVELDSFRKLITQTVTIYMHDFPASDSIQIRVAPVSSVSSVKYYDTDGTLQTFSSSSYWTDLVMTPPGIHLKSGYTWPTTHIDRPNAVEIACVCGYGAASAVPVEAKLAIKELAKVRWAGCDGSMLKYQNLLSQIQWTGYAEAQC